MSTLPHVSGRKVVQALLKIGYEKDRQKGSHIVMRQISYPHRRIVVPDHKEVAKGTLRAKPYAICMELKKLRTSPRSFYFQLSTNNQELALRAKPYAPCTLCTNVIP